MIAGVDGLGNTGESSVPIECGSHTDVDSGIFSGVRLHGGKNDIIAESGIHNVDDVGYFHRIKPGILNDDILYRDVQVAIAI